MSELFFTIKTKNENAVNAVLQKQKCVEFDGLNVLADYIELGQTVFIVFGGDKPQWETGLVGLGTIAKLPYGYEGRNFKVAVDMKVLFSKPIKRADLVLFPDTYDIIGIAPITKWEPNQALSQVETNKAYALLNAIFFIDNNAKNEFHNIFSADQMNRIKGKYRKFIVDDDSIESKTEQVLTETIEKPHNRIIFGAPGTGKSKKLSADFEKYFLTCLNSSDLHKQLYDEIHSQPTDADQAEWITALGIRYATYITEKYINPKKQNELIDDFDLLNNGEQTTKKKEQLVQGAKAAYRLHLNDKLLCYKSRGERVTFHPNYSYAQFVGTYKPVQDSADENQIKYEYITGPFMRVYLAAKQNPSQNFLLLIEEINRANVAAVFGDVFQLLDRDENGNSEYPVAASEDIKKYLAKNGIHEDELKIPSNMYIWATMNSADQGVFPMDTAFKRRWEFEYIGIDENEDKVKNYEIPISSTKNVNWNELRKAINNKLITLGINEDKLLGPFFLSKTVLDSALDKGMDFVKLFESKVLMYLFEDAAKMKAKQLFNVDEKKFIYSEVCKKFEEIGVKVFKFNEGDVVEEHDIAIKKDDAPSDGKLF